MVHPRFSEPFWVQVVGPPSSGKTAPMLCVKGHPLYTFVDMLTANGFVSAYEDPKNPGVDNSLIRQVIGKVGLVKDLASLSSDPAIIAKLYNEMRTAFDGSITKWSGNRAGQSYEGKFGMIICATQTIEEWRKKTPALGERFFTIQIGKFDIPKWTSIEQGSQISANLVNPDLPSKDLMQQEAKTIFTEELLRIEAWAKAGKLPVFTKDQHDTTGMMSWIVCMARTAPLTDGTMTGHERQWRVEQILTQAQVIHAIVCGRTTVTEEDMEYSRRLAVDTLDLQRSRILQFIFKSGGKHRTKVPMKVIAERFEMDYKPLRMILRQWTVEGLLNLEIDQHSGQYDYAISQDLYDMLVKTDLFSSRNVNYEKL